MSEKLHAISWLACGHQAIFRDGTDMQAFVLDDPFDSGAESEADSAVTVLSSGYSSTDAY